MNPTTARCRPAVRFTSDRKEKARMAFIRTPDGNIFNVAGFGSVKAVPGWFIISDAMSNDLLVFMEVPTDVAVAWRDALASLLASQRPNRPVRQLDWLALAAGVDPTWATEHGWTAPAAPVAAPASPAVTAAASASAVAPARIAAVRQDRSTGTAAG